MIKLLVMAAIIAVLWYTGILQFVFWVWGVIFMMIGAGL